MIILIKHDLFATTVRSMDRRLASSWIAIQNLQIGTEPQGPDWAIAWAQRLGMLVARRTWSYFLGTVRAGRRRFDQHSRRSEQGYCRYQRESLPRWHHVRPCATVS